jgi:DNA polymerase III subunit gamma/tau
MPDPGEVAKMLAGGVAIAPSSPADSAGTLPATFQAMIAMVEGQGKHRLAQQLRDEVGEVRYAPPELALRPTRPFDTRELATVLKTATGTVWTVTAEDGPAKPSLREQELAIAAAAREAILAEPVVAAITAHFPESELLDEPEKWSVTQ